MSVIESRPFSLRPWSGHSEPGLPVAIWTQSFSLTGDASGGSRTMITEFKAASSPAHPRLYNLEQMDIFDNKSIGAIVDILWNGFDRPPGTTSEGSGLGAFGYTIAMQASAIAGSLASGFDTPPFPILLGIPAAVVSQCVVQIRAENSDGDLIRAKLHGYVWDARSFQTDGGPQRPKGLWT